MAHTPPNLWAQHSWEQKTIHHPTTITVNTLQPFAGHTQHYLSNEKKPGWLDYIGDYTYIGDYFTTHYKDPYEPTSISWTVGSFFFSLLTWRCFLFFDADPRWSTRSTEAPNFDFLGSRWYVFFVGFGGMKPWNSGRFHLWKLGKYCSWRMKFWRKKRWFSYYHSPLRSMWASFGLVNGEF